MAKNIKRDYFFEFAGMPKSGKTTILDSVLHSIKRDGYYVSEFHGGGKYDPIDKKNWDGLNVFLSTKVSQYLLLSSSREKLYNRIFFLDRGIFDRIIFINTIKQLGRIDEKTAEVTINYLLDKIHTDKIEAVFLFITSPKLSKERENKYKLTNKGGRVMNYEFLDELRKTSLKCYDVYKSKFNDMLSIDTEARDGQIIECASEIYKYIISRAI